MKNTSTPQRLVQNVDGCPAIEEEALPEDLCPSLLVIQPMAVCAHAYNSFCNSIFYFLGIEHAAAGLFFLMLSAHSLGAHNSQG